MKIEITEKDNRKIYKKISSIKEILEYIGAILIVCLISFLMCFM